MAEDLPLPNSREDLIQFIHAYAKQTGADCKVFDCGDYRVDLTWSENYARNSLADLCYMYSGGRRAGLMRSWTATKKQWLIDLHKSSGAVCDIEDWTVGQMVEATLA